MMAVGIMTVGAVGLMSLQQATTRGNAFSREMTTASDITRTWVERLRMDALEWNATGAGAVVSTTYLSTVPATTAEIGPWSTLGTAGDPETSYAFDYLGAAADGDPGAIYFCTNVRFRWVVGNNAIRADVRTWWHRRSDDIVDRFECEPGTEDAVSAELAQPRPELHAVYGSLVIRPTPVSE
jgi:type IV pilus assembly protein PilV